MARTQAELEADLDAIQRAKAKGLRKARIDGEEVEFRDLKDMNQIEAELKKALGLLKSKRINYPQTSTGWR